MPRARSSSISHNDLFAHLSARSRRSSSSATAPGDIMARSTNDLNAVRQLLGPAHHVLGQHPRLHRRRAALHAPHQPRLTLFAFLAAPLRLGPGPVLRSPHPHPLERIQAMFSDISAQAEENFSGARLIRAFAQEEAQIALFETSNQEYIRRSLLLARLMAMLWPTLEFVLGISLMITLLVGGHEVVLHHITVGQFTTYNVYMVQLTWPMIAIGWVVNLVQRGAASVVRIDDLMTEKPSIDDANADPNLASRYPEALAPGVSVSPDPPQLQGHLRFNHLTFAYPTGPTVLHDITLDIPAGTSLAITGPTGSGKSTLVALIRGSTIHSSQTPSRSMDGRCASIRWRPCAVPSASYRRRPSCSRRPSPTTSRLALPARLKRRLKTRRRQRTSPPRSASSPPGFHTVVGERGMTLSGGQKQRNRHRPRHPARPQGPHPSTTPSPPVDTYTEEQILTGLREAMQGRTTILIAHRVSTARNADPHRKSWSTVASPS